MCIIVVDLRVDYLLPAPCEDLIFEAEIVHQSRRLIRVDSSCWDMQKKRKIAIGRGLFSVCDPAEGADTIP